MSNSFLDPSTKLISILATDRIAAAAVDSIEITPGKMWQAISLALFRCMRCSNSLGQDTFNRGKNDLLLSPAYQTPGSTALDRENIYPGNTRLTNPGDPDQTFPGISPLKSLKIRPLT